MGKMTIEGVPGADGTYECDLTYFTNRELHEIKVQTGLRAGELQEAVATKTFDNDVVVAFALVAFRRLGKSDLLDLIWDAPAGNVTFDTEEDEVAADDPLVAETPTGDDVSANGSGDGSDSSGDSSRVLLAVQASDPSPTGSLDSDTGGTSAQAI